MGPSAMKVDINFTDFCVLYREANTGLMEEYGQIKLSYNTHTNQKTWSENWQKTNKTA